MGIKDLLKLIRENEKELCTEPRPIRGEVIVDGYGLLHDLYVKYNLDWANGGCYAEQHRVTLNYFEALVKGGVKPIVVVDGGGCEKQHEDTVYRRKRDILEIPVQLQEQHNCGETSHLLPVMAREIFVASLKEKNIDVYVADGKATRTIVRLANYYHSPVLTNTTNYCVCGLEGGVILFEHFDHKTCEAIIYEQARLVKFCEFANPDLVFALVAIMGDGSDTSVRYFYHGRIKRTIEAHMIGKVLYGRSRVRNVIDFLRIMAFTSFDAFKRNLDPFQLIGKQLAEFSENCLKAEDTYNYSSVNTLSVDELKVSTTLKCSKPKDLPVPVLQAYRNGSLPFLAINAMTIGKCVLEQVVGDLEQPPPPVLGRPVRQLLYGLVSSLMNQEGRAGIREFYRSCTGKLDYEPHDVVPRCQHNELSISNIYTLEEGIRKPLAVQAICEVLQLPEDTVHKLEGLSDKSLSLVTLVTCHWARYLVEKEPIPNPDQLIEALVVNFFFNLSDPDHEAYRPSAISESKFSDPYWIKTYHTLLEWQNLYYSVCSINSVLCEPLEVRSPAFLFDGQLVFFLALHSSPDIIHTYAAKLEPGEKEQYKKVLDLVRNF